ncbi:pentatricopeptide repeat-containing At3g02650, mitochondrial [Olea europaea subsp. europaea]|uniref:Pentatricopeptide repeat-containing At3g02650, mitochondrial n=2 Tax=Olea europaea subsp. europaea TaxID=158383 RepID=A0A8S0RGD0_OLEEU|nr:pentatricopeptide repeat-containing At3g02650, mitochondrial [Olea europaea subsp. europaea]
MWRKTSSLLVRRTFLSRKTAALKFRESFFYYQVPNSEFRKFSVPCIESLFHKSDFSIRICGNFEFCPNPRFFSTNPSENYEEELAESEANEGFEGSLNNVFDESTSSISSELEAGSSIFNEDADGLELNYGLAAEIDQSSVSMDQKFGSFATEDEEIEKMEVNDMEKVQSLLSLLQSSGIADGSPEEDFEKIGLVLNEDFVTMVLETPYVPGENLIGFFRWVLKKSEFKVTTQVLDALVSAICKANRKREAYALWDLVQEVGEKEKGILSTESLTELIALLSRLGKGKAAFDVFNKFGEFGSLTNPDTYYITIEALCKRSFFDWACTVCEKMLQEDKLPNSVRVGKIISYLCRGSKAKDAHSVYLSAKDKKIYPPRSSVNFLISSLCRLRQTDKETPMEIDKETDRETVSLALEMLKDYTSEDRMYAIKPFSSVIQKLCWIEDVERAKTLLLEMIDVGPPPGNAIFNAVINGLVKVGEMNEAMKIMKLMESRGLKPDVYTYSVIMSGYAKGGAMEEACKIFDEAKKHHSKLSPVTYHTLIRGFCKLEQYEAAVNLLREMKDYGVHPNHDEYNKLIKSLCLKALDWETAEKLREEMKENGLILNGRTTALINAVRELQEEGTSQEVIAAA